MRWATWHFCRLRALELLIEVSKLAGLTAPSASESLKPLFSDDVVDTPLLAAELMEEDWLRWLPKDDCEGTSSSENSVGPLQDLQDSDEKSSEEAVGLPQEERDELDLGLALGLTMAALRLAGAEQR